MMHKSGTKNEIKESSIPFDFDTCVFVYMLAHMHKCMDCGITKIKPAYPINHIVFYTLILLKKISLSLIRLYISI